MINIFLLRWCMAIIPEIVDEGGSVDAVFLDFAKAFDSVPYGSSIAEVGVISSV